MRHLAYIVIYMQQSSLYTVEQIQQLQDLRDNLRAIYTLVYQLPVMDGYAYRPPTAQPTDPGRPRCLLSSEELACLRSEFNSWTQIASDLGVSRQTIYNRRRELGFSLEFGNFSHIQNTERDVIMPKELRAFLHIRGDKCYCWLASTRFVHSEVVCTGGDNAGIPHINRANRWGQRIQRRPYSVPHPNFFMAH